MDRDSVKLVMIQMVQAGRLQRVPHHPCLVRMGGVVRRAAAGNKLLQAMPADDAEMPGIPDQEDEDELISDKVCCPESCCRTEAT